MSKDFTSSPMKDIRGYLTPEQVKQLLDATKSFRDKLILRLLWATGCRIGELVGDPYHRLANGELAPFFGVRVGDVLFNESVILFDTLKRRKYPPEKRRVVLDEITLFMIEQWIETQYLTPSSKLIDLTMQRVWQILRDLGEATGIEKVGEKKLHPHLFRHSHCVAWIRDNNSMEGLRQLQQRLQHASISTTAHYLQYAVEESKEKTEKTFGKW